MIVFCICDTAHHLLLIFISSHGKATCDHHLAFPLSLVFRKCLSVYYKGKTDFDIKIQLMKFYTFLYCKFKFNL